MAEITTWPLQGPVEVEPPRLIKRPCDNGLDLAILNLETQLGTIEAYNRLCRAAHKMHTRIELDDVKPQNPLYAVDVMGKT